jgi:hypothetical protein
MANLQYIGARYVPIVFSNPDDNTANWKSGVFYEPLTIVTYLDDSYTSRKAVPTSIGNPADNPDYWVKTGDFNASLTTLQNEFNLLLGGNYLANKRVVVYGDSTVNGSGNYMQLACDAVNATLTNRSVVSTTMADGATAITNDNDLSNFDYVFLCYGTNDWGSSHSPSKLRTDVDALIGAINSVYRKSRVIFVLPPYQFRNFGMFEVNYNYVGLSQKATLEIIATRLRQWGVPIIDLLTRSSCNPQNYNLLLENSGGIYYHPLPVFRPELAAIVLEGANSNNKYKDDSRVDVFNSYDFGLAQRGVTQTYLAGLSNGHGLSLYIAAGTEWKSGYKHLLSGNMYEICGTSEGNLTIEFHDVNVPADSFSYTVGQGSFDMTVKTKQRLYQIILTTTATTLHVDDLHMYDIGIGADRVTTAYNKGRGIVAKIHNDVSGNLTFQAGNNFVYAYGDDTLNILHGGLVLASDVAFNTNLLVLDAGFYVEDMFIVAYKGSTPVILHIVGNVVKNTSAMTAGTYLFVPTAYPIARNNRAEYVLP